MTVEVLLMEENMETKTCPLCCEEVRTAAKKCPHCGHWQTKWYTTVHHPAFAAVAVGVPLLALWAGASIRLVKLTRQPDPAIFGEYIDDVMVIQSEMYYEESETERTASTVGIVKNKSPLAWKNLELEVQYFDEAGRLIDAACEGCGCGSTGTVLPGGEKAFRIRSNANMAREQYVSHAVFVRSAVEPGRW